MKHIYSIILLISSILILNPGLSYGQNISIKVKDNANNVLIGSTVQLTNVSDSSKKEYGITNNSGIVELKNIQNELYIIKISYIGYQTLEKTILIKENNRALEYFLKEKRESLKEVTVTAEKPLIRQEEDKTIIDPKPMIGISTNTLEVLENTPGLFIDYDSGIYLSSSTPAVIYVNGREQKLSSQDLMNLLRNLPPGSIEKIEIIRTPSTKYDAETSGGIINIILKKGLKIGRFGNVNAGMNQGLYGNRFAGFSINNSSNKASYYFNGNVNRNTYKEDLNINRSLQIDTTLFQNAVSVQQSDQAYAGYGISYDLNEKTIFSYDGRLNYSNKKSESTNNSIIKNKDYQYLLENTNQTNNHFKIWDINQDLNLNYKIDTTGSEWDSKLSYNLTNNNSTQDYNSINSIPLYANIQGNGKYIQQRQYIIFQSDLTCQLLFKIKLETGLKSSWQNFNSKVNYFMINNGVSVTDSLRDNSYKYTENINASYIQASKTLWSGILLKAGCRLEQTNMNGNQKTPIDTSFVINRVDLFPYVYISRKLLKIFGIELKSYLIFRRTIKRPNYDDLNPYTKYIDPFLYETGNPNLRPQFTNNIEYNISYEDMPVFAIGQNYTSDIFTDVMYNDNNQSEIAVKTVDNLGKNKETYFRGMAGIPPGGKYFFAIGAQYNLNNYNGFYEGNPLTYERGSWRFFTFHSLKLFKQTKIIMSGFMMVKGQQGFYELNNFGSLNFGITQSFLNNNLIITLSARDVLKTMLTGFELNQGNINAYGNRYYDNRRFGINIRYNFGLKKKEVKKYLKEDEDNNEM